MKTIKEFFKYPHYIKCSEKEDLISFHYNEKATFDRMWDDITRSARGIIFNKKTEEVVARPWEKFFNLNEMPETHLEYLMTLNKPFYVSKKMDGSLGILYNYNEIYCIATKGSFKSEQAFYGNEWIHNNLNLNEIDKNYTYLFEIIYPSNKIVVDYKGKNELVLIGMIHKETGLEVSPSILKENANQINSECVEFVSFNTISDIINLTKDLIGEEGFVITFSNVNGKDLKIKIKGEWYKKLHKIICNLTPLAYWEVWEIGGIKKEFLELIPEEFRELSDRLCHAINLVHIKEYEQIKIVYDNIIKNLEINDIKHFALECQKNYKENLSVLIAFYKKQTDHIWDQIHKKIRPTANIMDY